MNKEYIKGLLERFESKFPEGFISKKEVKHFMLDEFRSFELLNRIKE